MSILDSIKGTRKLSFDHWRYRLLHWAFNVENPDPKHPASTGMPKFLYTHFCPLFHLTNLIAILSPFILFIKIIVVVFNAFLAATAAVPWDKIAKAFLWFKLPKKKVVCDAPKRKRSVATETRMAITFCCEWEQSIESFGYFWNYFGNKFETLTREQVQTIFDEYYPKVIEARQRAKIRKDKLRERLIFWTNFSRVFIKWTLNIFYAVVCLSLLYGVYLIAGPVWEALCYAAEGIYWLFTDAGSLAVVWLAAKVIFWIVLISGGFLALCQLGWVQKFFEVVFEGLAKLAPPFYLVDKFFGWIAGGFNGVVEFVKMFYEENCPPIILVSPEEAEIEAVAENIEISPKQES